MRIILSGATGAMGREVYSAVVAGGKDQVVAGISLDQDPTLPFPIYANASELTEAGDVIIDFSHHSALPSVLALARRLSIPAVICSTGLNAEELDLIRDASTSVALLQSGNMSLGVHVLNYLVQKAAAMLPDFDIEIIESHHNRKLDAPSGTAKMILAAAEEGRGQSCPHRYGREGREAKRVPGEIGLHSIRGGTIAGTHEVLFAGADENITLTHQAGSRRIFAHGALKAAAFLIGKKPGLYQMQDLFE